MSRTYPLAALLIVLVGTCFPTAAQGQLSKGFKALAVYDYFQARKIFLKETKRQPAAAWYGLSVISGRADNPFFHVDSSYAFIQRSDAAFSMASDKQRASMLKLGVDHTALMAQREHVFQLAWGIAKGQHTIAAYDRYVNTYLQSPFAEEAAIVRDHLAFQAAREDDRAEAYEAFLERYPKSKQVFEARSRLQEAIYREATLDRDIVSYLTFIAAHPESPYLRSAEDEVFRLSTPGRTVEEYRKFIVEHQKNQRVGDAWRGIYEIRTRDLSVDAITRFLKEFPEYPFVEELVDDYKTASLTLLPFRREGAWGFIDDSGVERIKAEYEWVEDFRGSQAIVSREGKVGTVNRSGRAVVPIEYDDVEEAVEGTSTVERGGRVGAVDSGGELVVPMRYSDVGEFSEGMAYAAKDGKYGYINARGEELIPFRFSSAGTFHKGMAVVEEEGLFGVIDSKGNIVLATEFDWVEGFEQPYSRVRKGERMGLVGPFGDELLPLKYDHVGSFQDGLALVVEGRKCGYIDEHMNFVIPLEYEAGEGVSNWGDMRNGLAKVQLSGKRCLINARNVRVFPCQYTDIGLATGAIIPVRKKGKWGYADRKGGVLFDNRYDQAWEMIDGLARVRNGALFGAIDSAGRELIPVRFIGLLDVQYGHLVATGPNGSGLLDRSGAEVVALMYDVVVVLNERIAKVQRADRFGYIDLSTGRFIWREEGLLPDDPEKPSEQ